MSNQTKNATLVGGGQSLNNQPLENPKNAKGLDSKSKLESKNPNKIQTAKIQDSKASKDSIKLESNSPKLKDSKVSKTSKDSMKLESSPKLDSKNTRESKKIQRVKNTCDSITIQNPTNSQKSKESSKVKTLIRTIPVSIALASALSSHAVAVDSWSIAGNILSGRQNIKQDTPGYVTVVGNVTINDQASQFQAANNTTVGNLLIQSGVLIEPGITGMGTQHIWKIGTRATAGTIENQGTILVNTYQSASRYLDIGNYATLDTFINSGTMRNETGGGSGNEMLIAWENGTINNLINKGTIYGHTGVIHSKSGTIKNMLFSGPNSVTQAGSGNAINIYQASNIGSITVENQAKIIGNISLSNTSSITNGITIINSGSLQGNISLTNNARIQNGIVLDNSNMKGNISLSTENGGGNITIDSINIGNGSTMTGDISVVGNSKITDTITIDGTLDGNVSAIWNTGGNGTINQMDISGVITQKVQLDNKAKIATLNLNGGTITGGINFQGLTTNSNNDTATIDNLTLNNDAHIGGIDIGNTSGGNAKGVISNLTLNDTSSIGSIVNNRGTISELTLNDTSTITNGITNNSGGNIGTITSNTNNGVNNTITNSGTIAKLDIRNVNSGSSGNGGTINYIGDGIVTEEIRVEGGATLSINGGAGTITLDSNTGSKLNLLADSIFQGSLKNAGSISTWNNVSNIDGSFINANGASVGVLTAGSIANNLLNEGEITNLTINKNIGTLTNNGSGVINTLIIQDGSVITNGITNDGNGIINTLTIQNNSIITNGITNNSNIGSLNLQENVTYDGSGSITNALDIANNNTLTATNNGINILFANGATGTINNEGIIDGSLTNTASSTIKSFNTGSISGSITNSGSIQTLNVDSNVGSIANSGNINTLNVTGNVTNGITNKASSTITTLTIDNGASLGSGITNDSNIANLNVKSNVTYAGNGSITNALDIDGVQTQFTINNGASNTLTLAENANTANSVKTITNDGTIIGNLTNDLTRTDWTFGVLQGNFTNNGELTALTDTTTGSITGILTNTGIIKTLNTSKVVGSIANNGNLVNVIVDADKTLTGSGSITNSLVVEKNNGGNGYTLTIGSGGTGNLNFKATNGTINNAGTIVGNITNVDGSTIADFTNSGSFNGDLTNKGNITNFINSGNFTGNIANTGVITDFDNQGIINGTLTNNGNIGDFTNSGSIKEFNNEGLIAFYENNGIITTFSGNGTIYGVSNNKVINGNFENVANALKNTGTISGNVELVGQRGTCNSSTICQLSGLWNEGTIGGTFTNAANKTITSVINGSNSQTNINAVLNNGIANSGTINQILNYSNGTINNGITNNANANIESITNEGTINGGITNSSQIGMINNTGLITGNLTNDTSSIITTINTGSITGSIANSGEITTLNVTGNVTNGITNNSNITNLTINKGVNLGNSGITNNANIGSLLVNESVSYNGTGSITNALGIAKDKTLTANSGITFHATKGNVNNLGIIAGNLTLKGSSNTLSNAGTINGNLTNSANTSTIANSGSINGTIINNATNGTIINANDSNIVALDINESVIYNQGTNANITSNIDIASNTTLTTNGITLNATNGSVNNEGILAGTLTLEGSSNSVTNSGNITTIINNANNSNLTNNSNIGALEVNKNLNYSGSGSITNYAIIAKNTTLNNSTALIFTSNNQGLENKGIITGSLENKGNMQLLSNSGTTSQINGNITNSGLITRLENQGTISNSITNNANATITSFINSGTITGNLYNEGHIDTLHNTGTMGTIYNRSKNTIKELRNDKNSVIARIDNSNGRYDLIQNQGTILGDIKNDNGTITKLENANNGTITGQIISNSSSNSENNYIGTIMNAGVINSSHTINDTGSIQDKTNDAIFLDTISNVVTAIANSGSINGNVRVAGNSEVNVIENSKVIAGCIILEGGRIGNINNTNGAIANCMSFSSGASVDNLNNSGTIKDKITNDSGNITVNNSGSIGGITTSNGGTTTAINSGSIGEIITSNGGNTTIINGGKDIMKGGHIGTISNKDNSNTHIDGWTLDNPDNPSNPIIIADGSNTDGIHLKEDSIFVSVKPEEGKIYNYYDYIQNEDGDSIGQDFSQDDELFNALTFIDILTPTDNGDGTYSLGLDTKELSGKTLGASLIYSSRMRQIDTNNMLREINVKNFKTDFEILEQRERLKNQQALLENYKQQRESYLNGLTKDNKELKRVSSKESTSLSTYANNSNIKSDAIEVVDYYNKDTLASLDNLQATTKANQETYF